MVQLTFRVVRASANKQSHTSDIKTNENMLLYREAGWFGRRTEKKGVSHVLLPDGLTA